MSLNYSINFNIPKRSKKLIKFIIIHYTGMKSESKAIEKLCDSSSKVSAHYFIKYNGKLLNLVPDLYEAWHAGKSSWKNLKGLNKYSIGIEINNPGHSYGYPKFKKKQISTLKKLLKINKKIASHTANLVDDFSMISDVVLNVKKQEELLNWIQLTIDKTHIKISEELKECEFKNKWIN